MEKRGLKIDFIKENKLYSGIIFIVISIFVLGITFQQCMGLFRAPYKLENFLGQDLPNNSKVTVGVDAVIDWYAVKEKTTAHVFKTTEAYYCMVWLDDETFIGLGVREADRDKLDDIIDATWDYVDGKTYSLPQKTNYTGWLRKMSDDEKKYFNEVLYHMGYGIGEYKSIAHYYVIDTTNDGPVLVFALVIAFFLIGIICIIAHFIERRSKANHIGIDKVVSIQNNAQMDFERDPWLDEKIPLDDEDSPSEKEGTYKIKWDGGKSNKQSNEQSDEQSSDKSDEKKDEDKDDLMKWLGY